MVEATVTNKGAIRKLTEGQYFYQLAEGVTQLDVIDALDEKLVQLSSMLTMIHGHGYQTFDNYSDEIKDNYLWACERLADECKQLTESIKPA